MGDSLNRGSDESSSPGKSIVWVLPEDPINYALDFIAKVRARFQDDPEKYRELHRILYDFKNGRIDHTTVSMRAKELLEGHTDLIMHFNLFFPYGYEIPVPNVVAEEAIDYVKKIKDDFNGQDQNLKPFPDVLSYWGEDKSVSDIHTDERGLFEKHRNLLDDFAKLLPSDKITFIGQKRAREL